MSAQNMAPERPDCCGKWDPESEECRACVHAAVCMCQVLQFKPVLLRIAKKSRRKYEDRDPNPFSDKEDREYFDGLRELCTRKTKPIPVITASDRQRAVMLALLNGTTDMEGADGEVLAIYKREMAVRSVTDHTFELMPKPFRDAHKDAGRKPIDATNTQHDAERQPDNDA